MTEQRIDFRGHKFNVRTRDMLLETERLAGRQYVITQGSYQPRTEFSAGTHMGGGVFDLRASDLPPAGRLYAVLTLRRVGFAAWLRTPAQGDWPYHIHAVAKDDDDLSDDAQDQVTAYLRGRNGLASNGPDDGPRDYVNVVWETYLKNRRVEDNLPTVEELLKAHIVAADPKTGDPKDYGTLSGCIWTLMARTADDDTRTNAISAQLTAIKAQLDKMSGTDPA
jgi:hypothetical protein